MKIKTSVLSYDEVMAKAVAKREKPLRPNLFFRTLLRVASIPDLLFVRFTCHRIGMENLPKDQPCLILMNHSCFLDLEIAATLLFPHPFNIICTSDGFVGKNWLMRQLGCIPTLKFVTDTSLVRDMLYAVRTLRTSILMYPEASYSFDGTATTLPESLGSLLKMLRVPVVLIRTYGAFQRQPLYNGLRKRRVQVTADMEYLLSPEEIEEKSTEELQALLEERFSFDHFRWQQENNIRITEKTRAIGLNRVLYRCPDCLSEGGMKSEGTGITCTCCGRSYTLTEGGTLAAADNGPVRFSHIPDWYRWQRETVRQELEDGTYALDTEVDIFMMVDKSGVYRVGEGHLHHDREGFHLTGCDGKLDYRQKPLSSYSLYSDYYWYEIGDMICIGDQRALYYCFPKGSGDVVAKTRLAAEELYRLVKAEKQRKVLK